MQGGKLSVLAAAADSRVKAVACLDPVDNTKYAPLGVGYPSAVAALKIARPAGQATFSLFSTLQKLQNFEGPQAEALTA